MSKQERTEDTCEAEVEQPTEQGQRPVSMTKPSNCYGEWIPNGVQQMSDRLKGQAKKYKELMKKGKPKLLKKARTLQGNCSFFQ